GEEGGQCREEAVRPLALDDEAGGGVAEQHPRSGVGEQNVVPESGAALPREVLSPARTGSVRPLLVLGLCLLRRCRPCSQDSVSSAVRWLRSPPVGDGGCPCSARCRGPTGVERALIIGRGHCTSMALG